MKPVVFDIGLKLLKLNMKQVVSDVGLKTIKTTVKQVVFDVRTGICMRNAGRLEPAAEWRRRHGRALRHRVIAQWRAKILKKRIVPLFGGIE